MKSGFVRLFVFHLLKLRRAQPGVFLLLLNLIFQTQDVFSIYLFHFLPRCEIVCPLADTKAPHSGLVPVALVFQLIQLFRYRSALLHFHFRLEYILHVIDPFKFYHCQCHLYHTKLFVHANLLSICLSPYLFLELKSNILEMVKPSRYCPFENFDSVSFK